MGALSESARDIGVVRRACVYSSKGSTDIGGDVPFLLSLSIDSSSIEEFAGVNGT